MYFFFFFILRLLIIVILIINTIRSYISVYFGIHYYLFDWTYHWKKKILIKKKERKKKNWCLKKRKKKKKRSKKQKIFFSQIYPISISFLSFIHSYCSIWWCFCWKWSPWSYFWCKLLFFDFIVFFKPKKKFFFVILLFCCLHFSFSILPKHTAVWRRAPYWWRTCWRS